MSGVNSLWGLRAKGYQQFAAGSIDAATALTVPDGTSLALIIPAAQAVRWRDDGVNPSATVGQPLAVGSELRYDSVSISAFRVIAQTAGAILNVTYYGPV
jgi:hypothetical protein